MGRVKVVLQAETIDPVIVWNLSKFSSPSAFPFALPFGFDFPFTWAAQSGVANMALAAASVPCPQSGISTLTVNHLMEKSACTPVSSSVFTSAAVPGSAETKAVIGWFRFVAIAWSFSDGYDITGDGRKTTAAGLPESGLEVNALRRRKGAVSGAGAMLGYSVATTFRDVCYIEKRSIKSLIFNC